MSVKRVGLLVVLLVCGIGSALQAWAQTACPAGSQTIGCEYNPRYGWIKMGTAPRESSDTPRGADRPPVANPYPTECDALCQEGRAIRESYEKYDILSLEARILAIKMYSASAEELQTNAARRYARGFDQSTTSYIFVELDLHHPHPSGNLAADIRCSYTFPDGHPETFSWTVRIEPQWDETQTTRGWGSSTPGLAFPAGTYRVTCWADGRVITQGGTFVVR